MDNEDSVILDRAERIEYYVFPFIEKMDNLIEEIENLYQSRLLTRKQADIVINHLNKAREVFKKRDKQAEEWKQKRIKEKTNSKSI